jgi:undecaprenyl-diphosphatase
MLDVLYHFFLAFSGSGVIAMIIILGYLWLDRDIFLHALGLLQTSMLCNVALKYGFHVPLPSHLHKIGFAFPSGHMQSAIVLYGWLFQSLHNLILKVLFVILLIGIALGLVHFAYHTYYDVFAGCLFGLLILLGYAYLKKKYNNKICLIVILSVDLLLFVYLWLRYNLIQESLCVSYFCLLGMIFAECLLHNVTIVRQQPWQKAISSMLVLLAWWVIVDELSSVSLISGVLSPLKWVLIGSIITFIKYFTGKFSLCWLIKR